MNVLLINPSKGVNNKGDFWDFNFEKRILGQTALIPLSLPTIAGATPKDVDVKIIDENIETINFDEKVDLVGIGAMTRNILRAYEIADEFRKRGVKVVIGGIHASMMPKETLRHSDSVVIGEADYLWTELISDFKQGFLKDTYSFTSYPESCEIPIPRNDLIKSEKYVINQVQTSRGCPFDCDFCSVKTFSGEQYRIKSIEQVILEIESLPATYNIEILGYKFKSPKTLLFADDNIIGNKNHSKKLFERLIPMKLTDWYCQSSINLGRDKEMLTMMKEAGCHSVIIGIESVMEESLKNFGKKINRVNEYSECISNIQSAGMKVLGSFILGSDSEDESIFEKTAKFIKDNNLLFCMVNVLTPLPGTRLYNKLESEGRILHKDWDRYDFETVCFKPKNMSAETLQKGRTWIYKETFGLDEMQKRLDYFMIHKEFKEVRGFEEALSKMTFKEKFFAVMLVLKIFYKLNNRQRKFFLQLLKKHFKGQETNIGNTISIMSFNEYSINIE